LKTDKKRYLALSAVYATYSKEPVFGVFLIIALTNHIFRHKKESKKEKKFYLALILNGIIFILVYYAGIFRNVSSFYGAKHLEAGRLRLFMDIFIKDNPVLGIMFILSILRICFILFKKEREHLYYDCLLFAGTGYAFAYIILRMDYGYYFVPSVILFLPSVVYWVQYVRQRKPAFAMVLFVFITVFCASTVRLEAKNVRGHWAIRREFMPYIEELYEEYKSGKEFIWYEPDNTLTNNLSYKAGRNWRKATENAFLNYVNKSQGKDFFTIKNGLDSLVLDSRILLFYPVDNGQGQPVPENFIKVMDDNGFKLYKKAYGILIYRKG
jgi:hypothetical protein